MKPKEDSQGNQGNFISRCQVNLQCLRLVIPLERKVFTKGTQLLRYAWEKKERDGGRGLDLCSRILAHLLEETY